MTTDSQGLQKAGKGVIWAVVLTSSVAAAVLLTAPLLVGEMIRNMGFSPSQAGYIISAELGGMAFATIPSYFWLGRFPVAKVLKVIFAIFVVGNLATAVYALGDVSFTLLFWLRFFVATAGGSIMILSMTAMRLYHQPERLYALWVLGQLLFGAAWIALLPAMFEATGLYLFYLLVALMMAMTIPLGRFFPAQLTAQPSDAIQAQSAGWVLPVVALVGLFMFYVSLGGMWSFVERIAAASNISASTIGFVLSGATLMGVLGALYAVWLGNRPVMIFIPVAGSLAALVVAILILKGPQTLVSFAAGSGIFKFCWSFALPFMLGCIARIDSKGRMMASVNLIIGGGTALGPAAAGALLEQSGSYSQMVNLFIFTSGLCLVLMAVLSWRVSRLSNPA